MSDGRRDIQEIADDIYSVLERIAVALESPPRTTGRPVPHCKVCNVPCMSMLTEDLRLAASPSTETDES